ncbi:MAG: sporulation protein [Clostridia bacterium]
MTKHRAITLIICIMIAAAICGLVAFPLETRDAARAALTLCGGVLIPSLFPFFVLSGLLIESGIAARAGKLCDRFMQPLFRIPGSGGSALALGIIGGYPLGAATAIDLYAAKLCSKTEASRLLAFCNNSGPAFILGAVGVGILGSARLGIALYIIHVVSALLVGVLFRFYKFDEPITVSRRTSIAPDIPFSKAFSCAVRRGLNSCLSVCAFVVFFAVFLKILSVFRIIPLLASPFGVNAPVAETVWFGFFEVTTGLSALGLSGADGGVVFVLTAALLGFGGLSVHAQVMSFTSEYSVPLAPYFAGKTCHAAISALLAALTWREMPISTVTAACMTGGSGVCASQFWWLVPALPIIALVLIKKHWKNRQL